MMRASGFQLAAILAIAGSLMIATGRSAPAVMAAESAASQPSEEGLKVYIGTYTRRGSEGIYVCRLEPATGKLVQVASAGGVTNPSFLALHPNGKNLYAVSESQQFGGQRSGSVAAFAVEIPGGQLRLLNEQPTMGTGPCHLTVDAAGKHVLAANYSGGSVVVLPIESDGRLAAPSSFVQHEGSSVTPRQKGPHAHGIYLDAGNRFVFTPDLGLDTVLIYQYDAAAGKLTPNPAMAAVELAPGSGPRHFAFHPNGRFAYVINELNSTIAGFAYEPRDGTLTTCQTVSTLPPGFTGQNSTAEIAVSPDGHFVYGSNRGHDSIAVFAVDAQTGMLTGVSHHSTLGKMPRNFALDPTGTWLLAANQDSDNVVVFRVDRATGRLTPTGHQLEVPLPVCVIFAPLAK